MRHLFTPLLWLLSVVYRWGLCIDRTFRSRQRITLSKPVISIGNISLGGTGKTPLLIKIAGDLLKKGLRVAILSRGYRGALQGSAPFRVFKGCDAAHLNNLNDEILLMADKLPGAWFGVGANRVKSAQNILSKAPVDLFLLDDGFQHWALARNLDIVCVDVTNPLDGGCVVPLGRLREPLTSLSRAGVIALTRTELRTSEHVDAVRSQLKQWTSAAPFVDVSFKQTLLQWRGNPAPLNFLKGQTVLALSAIGNPRAFEEELERLGTSRVIPLRFSDHHAYTDEDLNAIELKTKQLDACVVTTEKDFMKLKSTRWAGASFAPAHVYVLRQDTVIQNDALSSLLHHALHPEN